MLRASHANAPDHLNLNMPFNGKDKLTFARLSLGASAFPMSSSSLGARQLKFRAGATRLNIFAEQRKLCAEPPFGAIFPEFLEHLHAHDQPVQNTSPPTAFILQCLAGDSAQPQKTLEPRRSTSQSLKRDSYPLKNQQRPAAQLDLPGRSPSYWAVGRPQFQARKTQAILASPGWASTVAVLPHCSMTKRGAAKEIRLHGLKFGAKNRGRLAAPKMEPRNGPSSRNAI